MWRDIVKRRPLVAAAALAASAMQAHAADPSRGAALYVQAPGVATSCVGCHGPDPAANRNNLLRAGNQPAALTRALNTVSAMGFLREALDEPRIADLSAYLGTVASVAAADAPVILWPRTVEFGSLALGEVSALHRVTVQNRRSTPLALAPPVAVGLAVDLAHDCPASLPAGGMCSIALRTAATGVGHVAGALEVRSSDMAGVSLRVPLAVEVTGGPSGRLSLALPEPLANSNGAAAIDFGSAAPQTMAVRELALRSHGTAPVTLGVAALTGPDAAAWALAGDCTPDRVLDPGTSCTARLTWTAGAAPGPVEAAVQWRSSGASPGTLEVQGRVTPLPLAPPPPVEAPAPPAPPALVASGGGATSVLGVILLTLATSMLVIHRTRKRHETVTSGS